MQPKKILNLKETAEFIGMNKRTFYRKLESREFPVRPVKGLTPRKWAVVDLENWLAGNYE